MKKTNKVYLFKRVNNSAANSLFSLEDLIGDQNSKSNQQEDLGDSEEEYSRRNAEVHKNRPNVAAKVKASEEEEVSKPTEENPPNELPNTKDIKHFPTKNSVSSTVKLDSTVNPNFRSKIGESDNIEQVVESENIHEGVSDEEDEDLKQQWEEFMKESEEFGKKDKEIKQQDKDLTESDVQTKLTTKNAFDYFKENPAVYLSKLIKKNDPKEGWAILEEVILQVESLKEPTINEYDRDDCEVWATFVMLFFLHKLKMQPVFETLMDKLEDMFNQLQQNGKLNSKPFAYEYFTVLLWESKSMERQAKEKLHILSVQLLKRKQELENSNQTEPREWPVTKHLAANTTLKTKDNQKIVDCNWFGKYFWVFGNNIDEQIKLVFFELNRLYMKSKDYRWGYKVLKKCVNALPADIETLLRIAKYCHYIGRNKESKKYYEMFSKINRG